MSKPVLVVGADGATGLEVCNQALSRGLSVRAGVEEADGKLPEHERLERRVFDVLNDDLAPHVEGVSSVISCLGVGNSFSTLLDPPPLYTDGTSRLADAMAVAGVRRLIVISASFVETADRGPMHFRIAALPALTRVFTQMKQMERMLAARDDLDWTAVRPGWLMVAPATDDAVVQSRVIPQDTIRTRTGDLAKLMLDCVENDDWVRGFPAVARKEDDDKTDIGALLDEFAG